MEFRKFIKDEYNLEKQLVLSHNLKTYEICNIHKLYEK